MTSSIRCRDLGTAAQLKIRLARIVTSDMRGRLIGAVSGNRARHHGLWFDVRGSHFSPQGTGADVWWLYPVLFASYKQMPQRSPNGSPPSAIWRNLWSGRR